VIEIVLLAGTAALKTAAYEFPTAAAQIQPEARTIGAGPFAAIIAEKWTQAGRRRGGAAEPTRREYVDALAVGLLSQTAEQLGGMVPNPGLQAEGHELIDDHAHARFRQGNVQRSAPRKGSG
jgi:hypothetical protein